MERYSFSYGAFHITAVPGQPQLAHCHGFFVPIDFRGLGYGNKLKKKQMEMLARGQFDYATCTVDSSNHAQRAILEKNGWTQLSSFSNRRNGSETELWGWVVTHLPNTEEQE